MVATPTRQESQRGKQKPSPTIAQLESSPDIVWEKLPEDFILPDNPVDNINQPALAAALTESLSLAGYLSKTAITTTNYGICVKYKGKTVVKAPDWCWVPAISVPKAEVERSYTPVLEGDLPLVVMEFLFATEGGEYSIKSSYPPGKLFFYEQILKVENYIIFSLETGAIDYYRLSEDGRYESQEPNDKGRYWLPGANLFLGVWEGDRQDRSGLWLRWWDEDEQMLLWGAEQIQQERERADKAEQVQKSAISKLKEMGLTADQIADTLDLPVKIVSQQLEP